MFLSERLLFPGNTLISRALSSQSDNISCQSLMLIQYAIGANSAEDAEKKKGRGDAWILDGSQQSALCVTPCVHPHRLELNDTAQPSSTSCCWLGFGYGTPKRLMFSEISRVIG